MLWGEDLAVRAAIQIAQQFAGRLHRTFFADDPKHITSVIHFYPEAAFDLAQVFIKLAA